ncbi:uncharacterized protein LOC100573479 [Acyrthosiphon pisum]|uniref:Uncharacterized protein n=1 Tax=Acyrthosiphon pisum TaxID=7029 RepID=A0A8R1WA52_ACYPI|nr:uncharacterized protein LOC100573479 [Acyrthosiphon pisum]|eukprot:XP_003242536.1 PREDICTED: uncharacterized protein LOC100573479 [Acyrthosiphon pisum]
MIPSIRKFMDDKTFLKDDNRRAAGGKVRVSSPDVDDMNKKVNKSTAVALQRDLDKPPSPSVNAKDYQRLQIYRVAGPSTGGSRRYQSSSRIESLAKPVARLRKPNIRLSTVFRGVDHQFPWCKKGPNVPNEKTQVAWSQLPPLPTTNKTGVSRAALKYEASEHIKRLAKPRPKAKVDDEKKCFMVKPLSLIYKPSLRIQQLSKPRIREDDR